MAQFTTHDGLALHYELRGDGPLVVLLHSFGFDAELWDEMGVVEQLLASGRSIATPDARGHGRSDRPHAPTGYARDAMARDAAGLVDHLGASAFDLVSYSMGSAVALRVLQLDRRVRRAVLGGIGGRVLTYTDPDRSVFPSAPTQDEAIAWVTRYFPYLERRLRSGASDAQALVEVLRAGYVPRDASFDDVTAEVLFLSGDQDDDPQPLADRFLRAQVEVLAGADHASTMNHARFAPAIAEFLTQPPG